MTITENSQVLTVRVGRKWSEATDICGLDLHPQDGERLPSFTAGSHIDLYLPGGIVRQYSLCNASTDSDRYQLGILREPDSRGGSRAVHEQINEGDLIKISAPRNHFHLVQAQRCLLFAGGIGITPILCMAEQLVATDADFALHYCARTPDRMAFTARLADPLFKDRVELHSDNGPEAGKLDLDKVLNRPTVGTHMFVCGPTGFMNWVIDTAKAKGWSSDQIHYEYFAAATSAKQKGDDSFEIELASNGKVMIVPAGRTPLEVLGEHGIEIPVSCEAGVCGTCVTRILSGIPDHRDVFLTDAEHAANDQFTPCCSRSRSDRLVLDL